MDNAIKDFFSRIGGITLADMLKLYAICSVKKYKPGEVIAREGDEFPYAVGILKGCIRTYILTPAGDDRTVRIATEGEFTGCAACIVGKSSSFEFLEAIEDTYTIVMNFNKIMELGSENIRIQRFITNNFREILFEAVKRIQFFATLSPEERYQQLLNESPKLLQRVPQKYLASYIGVTTVSLSRIRSRAAKN